MSTKAKKIHKAFSQGYEPGSLMSKMTTAQLKACRAWLKDKAADSRVFEMQLRELDPDRKRRR